MVLIAPALLGADPLALGEAISEIEECGADLLHIDVMDGHFVQDISFGLRTLRAIRKHTVLPLDVHLQVDTPERQLEDLIEIGADAISVHAESTHHLASMLHRLDISEIKKGVVLNPATPLVVLEEIIEEVDQVVLMTSNPGTSDFQQFVVDKIQRLRELLDRRGLNQVRLVADGGVTIERAKMLADAGADVLVAASAVFSPRKGDIAAAIGGLRGVR